MNSDVFEDGESVPVIGITIGDAAGIGPEVSLKAVAEGEITTLCRPVLIGDLAFLKLAATDLGPDLNFVEFANNEQRDASVIEVFDLD